jgi:cytoskeletal protein CcmA (bactofilin family)
MASRDRSTELAAGTLLRGRLTGQGDVSVGGHVMGDVELGGTLTVTPLGTVQCESLSASGVIVEGLLEAETHAGRIEVRDGGTLRGRVLSGALVIQPGANVSAQIDMQFDLVEPRR